MSQNFPLMNLLLRDDRDEKLLEIMACFHLVQIQFSYFAKEEVAITKRCLLKVAVL